MKRLLLHSVAEVGQVSGGRESLSAVAFGTHRRRPGKSRVKTRSKLEGGQRTKKKPEKNRVASPSKPNLCKKKTLK